MLGLVLSLSAEGDIEVIVPMDEWLHELSIKQISKDIDSLQLPPEDIGSLILVVDQYMEMFLDTASSSVLSSTTEKKKIHARRNFNSQA